jgi:diguanylate cyclase (GGDEF)-like protein
MSKNEFQPSPILTQMNWRGSLLLVMFLIFGTILPGQVQNLGAPIISNYETEQYKASGQNWTVVQDRRGVMYFGNTGGILEFDGLRWQLLPTPENTPCRALASGSDDTIYYGATGDFGYLAVSPTGKVAAVSLKKTIPETERTFNDVWQVESCTDGIYFLTRTRIFRFHNGTITVLPGKFAASQACVLNGTLFYADIEKGLCLVDGDTVVPIPQLAGVYNGKRITLAPFGRHTLLVGRLSGDFRLINLLALWEETSQRYHTNRPAPNDMIQNFPTELDALLNDSSAYMYKLVPLGPDAFAISTIKAGIITFDRAGKIIRAFNKAGGLLDTTVGGIMMDRVGNLWAATNSGISHIELSVPQAQLGARNGIDGFSLSAQFHKGRLYVGTFQNLLVQAPYRYTLKDGLPNYRVVKNSPSEVWQFLEIEGDLIAASANGLFQIRNEEAIKINDPTSFTATSLATSKRWPGHIFVGLLGGMNVFKKKTGPSPKGSTPWVFFGKMPGINSHIRDITEDVNGDLWAGTDVYGLLHIHFTGAYPTETAIHRFGPEQGLPGLLDLRAVSQGSTIFVVSPKGLFRTTIPVGAAPAPETIRFTPDTTLGKSFLNPPVALKNMIFDQGGSAFFSTLDGVSWAIPEKDGQYRMESRPFQGIPAPDNRIYLHHDGSLWLPGKALFRVDPKAQKDYSQTFNILIRKVTAKSARIIFAGTHGSPGSAFEQQRTVFASNQNLADVPELPYRENALSFEFSATFYEKPGTSQFQYLLEGFDKEWSEWSGEAKKEYTNLPEGNYGFRVRAKNVYGTLGHEAVYSFRILPPWYRTIWAYILWIIGSLSALFGIIYLYTLKLRRQKAHLENIVAERTQQLRDASLTDPLTGLRNRRFIQEVLQTDTSAFIKYKDYLLNGKNKRRATEEDAVFGLFMMDIDFFKKVNDTYGHDAGDQVLKQFATILTGSVRPDDAAMRVGGEEFLVVLKKTIPEYLPIFAAKILNKVATTPFDIGGGTTIQKTCSIGYTSFPFHMEQPSQLTFEQCIMVADLGLFYAKNHGRNQAVYLAAGPRLPFGEAIIQKSVTSLTFALQEGYLQIDNVIAGKKL